MTRKNLFITLLMLTLYVPFSLASGGSENDHDPKKNVSNTYKPSQAINTYSYTTAIGVRAIGTSGITFKRFTASNKALEGILGFGPGALSVTLLFEKYLNAFDEAGLNWYYGIGGHIASQSDWVRYDGIRRYQRTSGDFGVGVDGIFGMEYKINEIPIAVSLDVKPFLEVTTNGSVFLAVDPGLGIKFTF